MLPTASPRSALRGRNPTSSVSTPTTPSSLSLRTRPTRASPTGRIGPGDLPGQYAEPRLAQIKVERSDYHLIVLGPNAIAADLPTSMGTTRHLLGSPSATSEGFVLTGEREEVPRSFPQQLLWLLDELRPGGGGSRFSLSVGVAVEGEFDVAALTAAIADVSARHDILRTVVVDGSGVAYQLVATDAPADVVPLDLSAVDEATALSTFWARARSWRFDPGTPPLMAALLGRLGDNRHLLSLLAHHSSPTAGRCRCFSATPPRPTEPSSPAKNRPPVPDGL